MLYVASVHDIVIYRAYYGAYNIQGGFIMSKVAILSSKWQRKQALKNLIVVGQLRLK